MSGGPSSRLVAAVVLGSMIGVLAAFEDASASVGPVETDAERSIADSYSIRRTALVNQVPHYTTMTAARAAAEAIAAIIAEGGAGGLAVAPLQAYFTTLS